MLSHASGTDPRAMGDDPEFDITATDRPPHSGFGGGVHHCLGHFVARTDMSVALPLLARRMPDVEADGAGEWLPVSGNTGPIRFPLRFRAATSDDRLAPVETIAAAGRYAEPDASGASYDEHLRRPDLSIGTYCLRAGAVDTQDPHEVTRATSSSRRGGHRGDERSTSRPGGDPRAGPGARFHDITETSPSLVRFDRRGTR